MIFLAFPPLHVKYIMQFLLEVVVKVLHELLLESVDAVLNVAFEGLVPAEIEDVRVGRLDRLFHEKTRACAREYREWAS